jgi:hypothetical protein
VVTWSARAGVDMYGCSGSLDPGDVSAGRWWGYFTDLLVVLEGTRWRARLGRAEMGGMSADLVPSSKFWTNFGALRAPANFESNFRKSLAGPSRASLEGR